MNKWSTGARLLVSLACVITGSLAFAQDAAARNLFVSPSGDGSTGQSWKKALKSLVEIDWSKVQSGDHIVVDGGTNGITYTGAVNIPVSNLVIRQSGNKKHSGQVTISGLGVVPPAPTGVTFTGSNVHLIGVRRAGIKIQYFAEQLVKMHSNYCSIRNVDLNRTTGYPPYAQGQVGGIIYGGYYNRIIKCDIRDTNNNAVHKPVDGVNNLTIFRNCTFGNNYYGWWGNFGTAIYDRFNNSPKSTTYVDRCVFGPYFNKGIDTTEGRMRVSNSLFLGAAQGNLSFGGSSKDSRLNVVNCTFFQPNFSGYSRYQYNLNQLATSSNSTVKVRKSIFYGGVIHVPAGQSVNAGGNFQYRVSGNTQAVANEIVDPQFVDDAKLMAPVTATTISPRVWTLNSYALNGNSPATGAGSLIVNVTDIVPAYGPSASLPPLGGP